MPVRKLFGLLRKGARPPSPVVPPGPDLSVEAPQINFGDLPSFNMDASPVSTKTLPTTTLSTPNLHQDQQPAQPLSDASSRMNAVGRAPQSRRASATPRRIVSSQEHLSPTTNSNHDAESSEVHDTSWSGAVGKASLGKSGRVIERLMAEIDKHKRELNAEIQLRQELEKREDLTERIVDGLKTENANLKQAKETDAGVLRRRDRKIEELRADLEIERMKRLHAEESAKQAATDRDEFVAKTNRELSEAKDIAKHAKGHAEVLERSHKQLGTEYRQRTETVVTDLRRLCDERDEEKQRVKKLDGIVERLRREVDQLGKTNSQIGEEYEAYRKMAEVHMNELLEDAKRKESENDVVRKEAERVLGEARYLLNLGRNAQEHQERTTD